MLQFRMFAIIATTLISLLTFALGIAVGAVYSGNEFNNILMPFLSMTGTWASGIGTLAAVIVAIQIAATQVQESRLQGSLKCAHYSIVLVDDLLARVKYQKRILEEGGAPVASLYVNSESMARRYEGLFHQEQYLYLPGSVLDSLKKLAAGFFTQSVMTEYLRATLPQSVNVSIPANLKSSQPICMELDKLVGELEDLKDKLYKFRSTFPQYWHI